MGNCTTIVLWDCNGKLEATLFCSRRDAFKIEPVKDQMGMIAVKVTTTESFDEASDYLLRQVSKNGGREDKLVFGTMPRWAGGTLLAGRSILASGSETTRLLAKFPARTQADRETRRHNSVSNGDGCNCNDEDCTGK